MLFFFGVGQEIGLLALWVPKGHSFEFAMPVDEMFSGGEDALS